MTMIHPSIDFVLLFVENPQKSGVFYQQILGLSPVQNSPEFVMFMLKNGVVLGLWSRYTAEPKVMARAGGAEICLPVENVDEVYREWVNVGIQILQKPTDMDFGRTCVAVDPDGHRIRIHHLRKHLQDASYRK